MPAGNAVLLRYLGGCVYYLDNSTGEHLAAWWPEGGGEPMQCGNGGMDG